MKALIDITVILFFAAIFFTIAAKHVAKARAEGGRRNRDELPDPILMLVTAGVGAFVGFVVMLIIGACWVEVGPAQTMAVYNPIGHGIVARDYNEGWHLVPIWYKKRYFSTRLREYTMVYQKGEGAKEYDDSMDCQTNEGLSVIVESTTFWRIPKGQGHKVWDEVSDSNDQILAVVIRPQARSTVRMIVARYATMELYSNAPASYEGKEGVDFYAGKRQEIEDKIEAEMREPIESKGLKLEGFALRSVFFNSPKTATEIIQKQVALVKVKTQFFQSEAAAIKSQADQKRAEGEAEAIRLKSEALRANARITQLQWLERLNPEYLEVTILPDRVVPFINMPARPAQPAPQPPAK
jgi:regulator of protease activity HflC (stomatin/prohibitin superfamily)